MMIHTLLDEPQALQELIAAEPSAPSLPGVYTQRPQPRVHRGTLDVDLALRQWLRARLRADAVAFHRAHQALEQECAPLLTWALESWDYLLTTEGCRFLLRKDGEKWGARGDYRAVEQSDFHRLIIHTFRRALVAFTDDATTVSFPAYLADTFWPTLRAAYRALSQPPDERQRLLTAYSYLRCVPYRFLNRHHQTLVERSVRALPSADHRIIELYYLRFFTETAAAQTQTLSLTTLHAYRLRALRHLARANILAWALLLQIERY